MQSHSYLFFDLNRPFEKPGAPPDEWKEEFAAIIRAAGNLRIDSYGTLGFKADTRFMLHVQAAEAEAIQALARDLLHTRLGAHLRIAYALFGITRASQYNPKKAPPPSAPDVPHKYLVIYPFVKTIEWHLLPYDQRLSIMKDHVGIGRKFSENISQLLLYSFGVDDQEFIVSYQMDSLEEFQTLVMELRGTEGRRYTERDTPIFTCIHLSLEEALDLA